MRAGLSTAGVALVAAALLAGCAAPGAGGGAPAGAKLRVVATTTQVADFVRNVGGDRVQLTQLLKPNVDPHDYEVSPADVQAISRADAVVENGVGLERFLDGAISSAGFTGRTVDASKGVAIRRAQDGGSGDPHIWHDPQNAKTMVRNIAAGLAAADPADAAEFRRNDAAYAAKLDALDADIRQKIATIPPAARKLVTDHDAFGYYIARYHLDFVGSIIPSFDSSAELSAQDISDIVARIRATSTKAIFSESSLPPRTAETIGGEAGVKVVAGEGALYGDTLGPPGSPGATYLAMEEHNTDTIVEALRG